MSGININKFRNNNDNFDQNGLLTLEAILSSVK